MADQLVYTRGNFKSEMAVLLGEALGTTGGGNPFTIDRNIDRVVANICEATDCFFWGGTTGPGAYGTEIVSGQIDYCAPPLYKIIAITARDQSGTAWPLTILTEREMDRRLGSYWRTTSSGQATNFSSAPSYAYLKGQNSFGLYPVPNYSTLIYNYTDLAISVGGTISSALRPFLSSDAGKVITITGGTGFTQTRFVLLSVDTLGNATVAGRIGTPGSTAGIGAFGSGGITLSGYGTPPPWPDDDDVCPLQPKAHAAVLHGLCELRSLAAMSSRDKETRQIATSLRAEYRNYYEEALGYIEVESATISQHSEPGFGLLG
jgi:hypothetical protein